MIFESNQIGFGASGRNGGWCSGFLPVTLSELEKTHGRIAAIEMYKESFRTLDEIENVITDLQIDCDYHRGGTINVQLIWFKNLELMPKYLKCVDLVLAKMTTEP